MTMRMFESDGHERIASAANGHEAIALIEKEKFSLVLLDLMMPDLNGDEVLKVIKSNHDRRDVPVVMISADTNADKVSQCIELGADDYLPKPFNPAILRARIGAALRRHSLRALENEYVGKIENEKRHSENLLRNILPAEIVTRLLNGESNIANHFDDATVIFADVVAGLPVEDAASVDLCPGQFAFPRNALMLFVCTFDVIFELPPIVRELFGQLVDPPSHIATD
jgi:adenylate cyclase